MPDAHLHSGRLRIRFRDLRDGGAHADGGRLQARRLRRRRPDRRRCRRRGSARRQQRLHERPLRLRRARALAGEPGHELRRRGEPARLRRRRELRRLQRGERLRRHRRRVQAAHLREPGVRRLVHGGQHARHRADDGGLPQPGLRRERQLHADRRRRRRARRRRQRVHERHVRGGLADPPEQDQRHELQRQRLMHADRHMPGRHVHGRRPRRLRRPGSVPRRRHLQPGERHLLQPDKGQRRRVQRRRRLHAERHVPGRRLRGREPDHLHRLGSVPRRGHLQPGGRHLLQPQQGQRIGLQRRRRVHAERHVPGRRLHRREPGHVHRPGSVPRRGHLQPGERHLQ